MPVFHQPHEHRAPSSSSKKCDLGSPGLKLSQAAHCIGTKTVMDGYVHDYLYLFDTDTEVSVNSKKGAAEFAARAFTFQIKDNRFKPKPVDPFSYVHPCSGFHYAQLHTPELTSSISSQYGCRLYSSVSLPFISLVSNRQQIPSSSGMKYVDQSRNLIQNTKMSCSAVFFFISLYVLYSKASNGARP